jgi:tetratricopeptide (TPR) repeat protein
MGNIPFLTLAFVLFTNNKVCSENSSRWQPVTGMAPRHKQLLSTVALFLNKKSKCNLERRSISSTEELTLPARIMEAVGNPVDVSNWDGEKLDQVCGIEGIFSRSPELGDALVDGNELLENLELSAKDGGVTEASKFGTCELKPTQPDRTQSRKNKEWDHFLFNDIELAKSLASERLLLSEAQLQSNKDDEVFSALSLIVRGSLMDMEIGTAAWHATSQGSLLWFALPPGQDLPFQAWQSFETWILQEMNRMVALSNRTALDKHLYDPMTKHDPSTDDFLNSIDVFGIPTHPAKHNVTRMLSSMKICQQHEGDLIAFPENWRRWAIALEDAVLISRRAGSGDTKLRRLKDRILDKAQESTAKEDAIKVAKDLGLLQKIEQMVYPNQTYYHVKTLMAKGRALTTQNKRHEAATAYREVLNIDPTNLEAMHNMATNILGVQENPFRILQAEGLLRKVVLRQPGNGDACNALAGLLLELSKDTTKDRMGMEEQRREQQGQGQRSEDKGTARVAQTIKRRFRLDALRFARQAVASVEDVDDENEAETRGRWHVTAAKAFLNLQDGDVPSMDAGKRTALANGYLCKGIGLIKTTNKTWKWVDVRKRLGLHDWVCTSLVVE